MRHRTAAAAVLILVPAVACTAGDEGRRPETVRWDSAGVEIVVNSTTPELAPIFAELDSVPEVRLGSVDGSPEEQFGTVTDLVALPDGGVAILDGQAAQVRYFGPQGDLVRTFGSPGDGPHEFRDPIEMALLPGDTLAVFDRPSAKVVRFHLRGSPGRTTRLQETESRVVAASFLPDGKLITQSRWVPPGGGRMPGPELTLVRDTVVLLAFTSEGALQDTVDVVAGRETISSIQMSEAGIDVFRQTAAFGRSNVFVAHPDGVWSGANDQFEIRLVRPESGRLLRVVRAPGLQTPVSDRTAELVRERAMMEAETPDDRRRAEAWYDLSPRPATQPAFDLLEVDPRGRLWLREWTPSDTSPRWWVFEGDGRLRGSVRVPPTTVGLTVGCNLVWAEERDELDVSYVARYGLSSEDDC